MHREDLLKIPEIVEEVKRHLWIESEKAGYDIGFDRAADSWIDQFSRAWLEYHRPDLLEKGAKKKTTKSTRAPRRSAKSYFIL